jgi:hypothetical protein
MIGSVSPWEAAFVAGKVFQKYRSADGVRRSAGSVGLLGSARGTDTRVDPEPGPHFRKPVVTTSI